MKYKVRVTREHIMAGAPGECGACPVAIALGDAFPDYHFDVYMRSAGVYLTGEHWTSHTATATLVLPEVVPKFINRFDSRRPCKPFSFTIEA